METDSNDSSSRGISFLSSSQSTASINSSVLQSSECASELFERSSEEQADHHVSSCQEMSDGDDNGEQLDADDADPASEEVFNKPLYHGSNITLLESYMMIMKYSLRHSLTKQALGDLLALVDAHLPVKSMVSLYKLKNFFFQLYDDISFTSHYCCSGCQSTVKDASSKCSNGCGKEAIEFLAVSVEPQLKRRFAGNIIIIISVVVIIDFTLLQILAFGRM